MVNCKRCGKDLTNLKYHMESILCWNCYDRWINKENCDIQEKVKEDIINKPNHYHTGIQPIEAIETNFEELETNGFLKGNVIKYVLRSNKKGKELEDLKKAQWNLNKLIDRLENLKGGE